MNKAFLKKLPFEEGKTYLLIGSVDTCQAINEIGLFIDDTGEHHTELLPKDGSNIKFIQALDVRSARLAVDQERYDGVISLQVDCATQGHVQSLVKPGGWIVALVDASKPLWNAIKGESTGRLKN